MLIYFDEIQRAFFLEGPDFSYIFRILATGYVSHLYWGKPLSRQVNLDNLTGINRFYSNQSYRDTSDVLSSYDMIGAEYPGYGTGDYRHPAYHLRQAEGNTVSELLFKEYRITPGKPRIPGLPASFARDDREAATLELVLTDSLSGLEVSLFYTVFRSFNVLCRRAAFRNTGSKAIDICECATVSVDFASSDFSLLQLSGAWARERSIVSRPLAPGTLSVESTRGASSHVHNPFIAMAGKGAGEYGGEVYGFNLVYSGNFLGRAEVNQYDQTRVTLGINPFDFTWHLMPGSEFFTPEAVMVYSAEGLSGMSHSYHSFYSKCLIPGDRAFEERPVLLNNWEATYFDFTEEKLIRLASCAAGLGIELFVLDDGWFAGRNDDTSSLGDWYADKDKLPGGLKGLGEKINDLGLCFGIWIEPEMVSPDSALFKEHPDWVLSVKGRKSSLGRNQLVLDLSRQQVCDRIVADISAVLESGPISYVKWDMNRNMTEIASAALPPEQQRETAHRYMLGLYSILERITSAYPHILFEGCAAGGGRFDPGMLYYMPQIWASDNTDAVSRLSIQYGTSLVYPISTIGSHVSAVPNHQTGRFTSLQSRINTAYFGTFGFELDVCALSEDEKKEITSSIKTYKSIGKLLREGRFYRLLSPFEGNRCAWMAVSEDKTEAFALYFRILSGVNRINPFLKLRGLAEDKEYRLTCSTGEMKTCRGDELMHAGIMVDLDESGTGSTTGDFFSCVWHLVSR